MRVPREGVPREGALRAVIIKGIGLLVLLVAAGFLLRPAGTPDTGKLESRTVSTSKQAAGAAQHNEQPGPVPAVDQLAAGTAPETLAHYLAAASRLGAPPASLAGTEVDGELRADSEGNLIVEHGLRRVFDYFLATLGEEDLPAIKARIALYLHEQLPALAAAQAWALLQRYLAYDEALAALPALDGSVESMHQLLRQRSDLRRAWLGQAAADAFFSLDDAFDAYSLERVALQRDDTLSAAERRARQQQLERILPAPIQQARQQMRAPVAVAEQVEALRAQGADEETVRQLRAQHFGPEAAERLQQLDEARSEWDSRYAAWRAERAAIQASGLAEEDQVRALEAAMAQHFSEQERRRVQALDRLQAAQ